MRAEELLHLCYRLDQLMVKSDKIRAPLHTLDRYFSYFKNGRRSFEAILPVVRDILPEVLSTYRSMVMSNFSSVLADHSRLFQAELNQIAVEVYWNPNGHTDYLTLVYVVLHNSQFPEGSRVLVLPDNQSLTRQSLVPYPGIISQGGDYGVSIVSLELPHVSISKQEATIYKTWFPSHHPILDQVYQLMSVELSYLLRTSHTLHNGKLGRVENKTIKWWVAKQCAE